MINTAAVLPDKVFTGLNRKGVKWFTLLPEKVFTEFNN